MFIFISIIWKSLFFENTPNYFIIERSRDNNQIFYTINADDQGLSTVEPVEIHWVKHSKNGKREPLNWIQKTYAYGLKYLKKTQTVAEFQFVSYPKRNFTIKKDSDGMYKVFTTYNNEEVVLKKIYVHIKGGSFWLPNVPQVDIEGLLVKNCKQIKEIVIP